MAPRSSTIAKAARNIFRDAGTRFPSRDKTPKANAMSVAIGIPQPTLVAVEELKKILISIPPPINSLISKPLPPRVVNEINYSKVEEDEQEEDTSKILGFNKNTFFLISGVLILAIGMFAFNNFQQSNRMEIEQKNNATEKTNLQLKQQEDEILEQNNRIAEQEKIETERIAKEKKQAIDNRLFEIRDLLITNHQNLENAKSKLNSVTGFQLLRTSSERNEQISSAQKEVDYYKSEIESLETEFKKINPED